MTYQGFQGSGSGLLVALGDTDASTVRVGRMINHVIISIQVDLWV